MKVQSSDDLIEVDDRTFEEKIRSVFGVDPSTRRSCGDCAMCCTYRSVEAGGVLTEKKKINERCRFCTGRSCSVYAERPHLCRIYKCLWLIGLGPEEDRPDRSKLLVDCSSRGEGDDAYVTFSVTACIEPGEAGPERLPPWVQDVLRVARESGHVIELAPDPRADSKLIVPDELMEAVKRTRAIRGQPLRLEGEK